MCALKVLTFGGLITEMLGVYTHAFLGKFMNHSTLAPLILNSN